MKPTPDQRRLQRNEVRNISFVELLAVVVFSLLLVVSFSMADLDAANSNLITANHDRAGAEKELAVKIEELAEIKKKLAELRELDDPNKMTRLVNISMLHEQEKKTLEAYELQKLLMTKLTNSVRKLSATESAATKAKQLAESQKILVRGLEKKNSKLLADADRTARELKIIGKGISKGVLDKIDKLENIEDKLAERDEQLIRKDKQVIELNEQLVSVNVRYADAINRLEFAKRSMKGGGGIDNPPCWPAGKSKVHPVFKITLYSNKAVLIPIWPEARRFDALNHPIFKNFKNGGELNKREFIKFVNRVRNFGEKKTDTPCVYYSKMVRGEDSDKKVRAMVGYFGTGFYPVP
jgi:hypothetical protein